VSKVSFFCIAAAAAHATFQFISNMADTKQRIQFNPAIITSRINLEALQKQNTSAWLKLVNHVLLNDKRSIKDKMSAAEFKAACDLQLLDIYGEPHEAVRDAINRS
jgi:hypothetical protein